MHTALLVRISTLFLVFIPKTWSYTKCCSRVSVFRPSVLLLARGSSGKGNDKKYTKSNLPSKVCVTCGRPFSWRKKWEKVWDDVKYCSDRCRNSRGKAKDGVESVQDSYKSARRSFSTIPRTTKDRYLDLFSSSLSLIIAASAPLLASSAAKAAITNRPTTQELLEVFKEWDDSPYDAFSPSDFRRLDESSDTNFYSEPRFVEHIDKKAVEALTKYHDIIIKSSALGDLAPTSSSLNNSRESNTNKIDVLDLCSSWVSHISPTTAQTFIQSAVGIGMNMEELNRNKLLTERVVQDLNKNPSLKNIPENSFDLCLLQLSIDYLTRPVEVMKELARVLKPNGKIVITFSNRVFIDKAVAGWTGKSDIDHIQRVGDYLYFSGGFQPDSIKALDLLRVTSINSDGDPLYAVIAQAK